ncbi:MAG TPA: hypothetical protein VGM84_08505 [Steroidobacteraceae bacterium]|jgi:hypothetical protein
MNLANRVKAGAGLRAGGRAPGASLAGLGMGLLLGLLVFVSGCGHLPWHRKPPPPPTPVNELTITTGEGGGPASVSQYWKRNTLVVDLQGLSGTGSLVMKPREGTTWPVRVAFRVMPGQFGILTVRGEQRMLIPITAQGNKPVDLELSPYVYTTKTPQLEVKWEPATQPQ